MESPQSNEGDTPIEKALQAVKICTRTVEEFENSNYMLTGNLPASM